MTALLSRLLLQLRQARLWLQHKVDVTGHVLGKPRPYNTTPSMAKLLRCCVGARTARGNVNGVVTNTRLLLLRTALALLQLLHLLK